MEQNTPHKIKMRFEEREPVDYKHRFDYSESFLGHNAEKANSRIEADVLALHDWTEKATGLVLVNRLSKGMMVTIPGKEPALNNLMTEVTIRVEFDTDSEKAIDDFKRAFGKRS